MIPGASLLQSDGELTIGLRCAVPDASAAFYRSALGLQAVPGDGDIRRVSDGAGMTIELHPAEHPPRDDDRVATIANPAIVNLTFYVDALDAVCGRIMDAGGRVLPETRSLLGIGREGIFAADPDLLPIELITAPAARGFAHVVICVPDLSQAVPFYEALGYEVARQLDLPEPIAAVEKLTRIPGVRLRGTVLKHAGGSGIELIELIAPQVDHRRAADPAATTWLSVRMLRGGSVGDSLAAARSFGARTIDANRIDLAGTAIILQS